MGQKTQIYWESPQVFDSHIFAIVRFVVDGFAKLVFVSVVVEKQMIHLHQPYEALCFHLPSLHLLYWGTVFLTLFMVDRFHPLSLLSCLPNL